MIFCVRTNNVSWTSIGTKELSISFESHAKIEEKCVRPSMPTMGLDSLTCKASAVFSEVILSSPLAW